MQSVVMVTHLLLVTDGPLHPPTPHTHFVLAQIGLIDYFGAVSTCSSGAGRSRWGLALQGGGVVNPKWSGKP
jgi:hypothetical protein